MVLKPQSPGLSVSQSVSLPVSLYVSSFCLGKSVWNEWYFGPSGVVWYDLRVGATRGRWTWNGHDGLVWR